jgi:hypothetical protein
VSNKNSKANAVINATFFMPDVPWGRTAKASVDVINIVPVTANPYAAAR